MTPKRRLYLLGGSPAYPVYADDFVAAAGGHEGKIAALMQTRAGWEKHKSGIQDPWVQRGVKQVAVIVPNEEGILYTHQAVAILQDATGIFIGGGHTPTYHRMYAREPMRSAIRARYHQGVPVAGVSAGALISMDKLQLTTDETNNESMEIVAGLHLTGGFVVGVHFTEREALSEVLETMKATRTRVGVGIDEPACVVCEDGEIVKVLGRSVHRIEMLDFERTIYEEKVLTI